MRHGTEAENLRWKHISLFEDKGLKYLEMSVSGKTGRRDIICRAGTINYLKRIQSRCPDIAHLSFEQLIKSKRDEPVFRLPDGTASANLRQTFRDPYEEILDYSPVRVRAKIARFIAYAILMPHSHC